MTLIKNAAPVPSLGPRKPAFKDHPKALIQTNTTKPSFKPTDKPSVKSNNLIKLMQENIARFAKIILNNSSSNSVVYNLISAQSNTGFNIISAMSDIVSNPKKQSDGIWGLGTQSALNDIYRVAVALLNTNVKFNLKAQGYDLADLSNFRTLISNYGFQDNKNSEPLENQQLRAKIISTHLSALSNYYNIIVAALQRDERVKLENNGLVEYQPRKSPITTSDLEVLKNKGDQSVHVKVQYGQSLEQIPVPIWVLENKEKLSGWLEQEKQKKHILKNFTVDSFFNDVLKPQLS